LQLYSFSNIASCFLYNSVALDQGLTFLISDQGATVRDELTTAVVGFVEELIFGAVDYGGPAVRTSFDRLLSDATASASSSATKNNRGGAFLGFPLQATSRLNSVVQYVSQEGASTALLQFATRMADAMALQSQAQLEKASSSFNSAASIEIREEAAVLDSASRFLNLFVKSVSAISPVGTSTDADSPNDMSEKYRNIVRRALREPVSQTVISRIISELSERIAGKTVQRILRRQPLPSFLKA